jgi:hypothetical protein
MRRVGVLGWIVAAACGRAKDPGPATPPSDAARVHVERDAEPRAESARALVLTDGKLLRLARDGSTEPVVDAAGSAWCDVDEDHRVVWLVSTREVSAYDSRNGKLHPIARGFAVPPAPEWNFAWQVHHQPPDAPISMQTAGNADGLEHCVALAITIGPKPRAGGEVIADGDRVWYCFDDPGESEKLDEDAAPLKRGYDRAELVDAAFLVELDARRESEGPRERPTLVAPPAPTPKVDPNACEEEPNCGSVDYVGGSRVWWVVTSNARGDFYHETRALYDAKTSEFWDPLTDARSETPVGGGENVLMHTSPDGTWALYGDKILSLDDAKVLGTFAGSVCGFE